MSVSVVMAVYNGGEYVAEAIESVLSQTHRHVSLIVVDDGSTDRTISEVHRVADDRVTIIEQENSGVAPARNKGIDASSADLVAFIDHDDLWFPEKLEKQLALMNLTNAGIVGSRMQYLCDRRPLRALTGGSEFKSTEQVRAGRLMPFPLSSTLIRSDVLKKLGGFDESLAAIAQVEDLDLLMRAARLTTISSSSAPLGYYRVHGGAASFQTFHKMRRGTRYLRARYAAELNGKSMDWQTWSSQFVESRRQIRDDRANFHYRSAGFELASRSYLSGVKSLLIGLLSSPSYVVRRFWGQFVRTHS